MRKLLPALFLTASILVFVGGPHSQARAGEPGWSYYPANAPWMPDYRHNEDPRRYNAAPRARYRSYYLYAQPGGYSGYVQPTKRVKGIYKVRTIILHKRTREMMTYDEHGSPVRRNVHVMTCKDVYSNGSCRIYQQTSH